MSTRLNLAMLFVVLLGVLAAISGPVSRNDLATAMPAEQPLEWLERPELLAPNLVLDQNVAILSLNNRRSRMTNTAANLYMLPDAASKVVYTIMPGTEVMVAGDDANNTFAAITDTRSGTHLYGWVATGQLGSEETEMQVLGVTQVYSQASLNSVKLGELGPYDLVNVVGMSLDENWVAVSGQGMQQDQMGWIESHHVQQLDWQRGALTGANGIPK